jgi:predicted AAA+ superfamily ATPase
MIQRHFWQKLVETAWSERSIVWLAGVRRVGKTSLSQTLTNVRYYDCELPRVRRMLEDPESFLDGLGKVRIVLDEIHRLPNPSEVLKIAADHYPHVRILATGSSTLGKIQAFRHLYPKGDNIVVAHDVKETFTRKYDDIAIQFESLPSLIQKVVE